MDIAEKVKAITANMTEKERPAAWLAYLVIMLKAGKRDRYVLNPTGSRLLSKLADRLPILGLKVSVMDLMTNQQLTVYSNALSVLDEVSINLRQTAKDLSQIVRCIIDSDVPQDSKGRTRLDDIGNALLRISSESIEATTISVAA